jgi:hypothetical protein
MLMSRSAQYCGVAIIAKDMHSLPAFRDYCYNLFISLYNLTEELSIYEIRYHCWRPLCIFAARQYQYQLEFPIELDGERRVQNS